MTQEQQRVAIAKACGWKKVETKLSTFACDGETMNSYGIDPKDGNYRCLPLYLSNLNAMQKAINNNVPPSLRDIYQNWLSRIVDKKHRMATISWLCITADAKDHAEAFLKTLKLWTN